MWLTPARLSPRRRFKEHLAHLALGFAGRAITTAQVLISGSQFPFCRMFIRPYK